MQPSDTRASQSAMQPASVWEELSDTPGGSLQPGVTGLTNKKTTLFYTPPSFEKLSD